jgi:hypothetical protein
VLGAIVAVLCMPCFEAFASKYTSNEESNQQNTVAPAIASACMATAAGALG